MEKMIRIVCCAGCTSLSNKNICGLQSVFKGKDIKIKNILKIDENCPLEDAPIKNEGSLFNL
jgi:hypothetical protein